MKSKEFLIVAMRGRNIVDGKRNDYFGTPTLQRLEINRGGVTNCLTSVEKDNLVMEIKVNSTTKQGFEVAGEGDSITFSHIKSNTRRGRVGKQQAQTLDSQSNQAVIVLQKTHGCTTTTKDNETGTLQGGGCNVMDKVPHVVMTTANCLTPDAYLTRVERNRDEKGNAVLTSMCDRRIRRLTEVECERLQGYPDDWTKYGIYDGVVKEICKSQRYKLCGNAVTRDIVEMIGKKLIKEYGNAD